MCIYQLAGVHLQWKGLVRVTWTFLLRLGLFFDADHDRVMLYFGNL